MRPRSSDLVIAAAATALAVASVLTTTPQAGTGIHQRVDALAVVLAVLTAAPLATRRTLPFATLGTMCAAMVVESVRGSGVPAAGVAPAFAAFSAAYLTDRRGTIISGAIFATAATAAAALALQGSTGGVADIASTLTVAVLAVLIGDVMRTLAERNAELDVLRATEAREAVAEERVRIARDVHDVVGHALAGIALQARAGRRLLAGQPADADRVLALIDELSTEALGETRQAVGLIRERGPSVELAPAPGLEDLESLVARLQQDDLRVRLAPLHDAPSIPPMVQTAAYRIVQEALSNVARHARPATANVTLACHDDRLELEVRDDGRPRDPAETRRGHGVRGMRERAAQCGGALEAGPHPEGGWSVRAELPIGGGAA